MTQFIPMRTTDPPGRLRHGQGFRLQADSASAEGRGCAPAGREKLATVTLLAGLLEHSVVT